LSRIEGRPIDMDEAILMAETSDAAALRRCG